MVVSSVCLLQNKFIINQDCGQYLHMKTAHKQLANNEKA